MSALEAKKHEFCSHDLRETVFKSFSIIIIFCLPSGRAWVGRNPAASHKVFNDDAWQRILPIVGLIDFYTNDNQTMMRTAFTVHSRISRLRHFLLTPRRKQRIFSPCLISNCFQTWSSAVGQWWRQRMLHISLAVACLFTGFLFALCFVLGDRANNLL